MNILLLGEYNVENVEFFKKFENGKDIVVNRYWTNSAIKQDCFYADSFAQSFKSSIYNVLFDLSFEPDIVFIVCENITECWGISAIKRDGYISSLCYSLVKEIPVPFDGLNLAILETFEKNFVLNPSGEFVEFFGFLNTFKKYDSSDTVVKQVADSIVLLKEDEGVFWEKIIKEIGKSEKNIVGSEVRL